MTASFISERGFGSSGLHPTAVELGMDLSPTLNAALPSRSSAPSPLLVQRTRRDRGQTPSVTIDGWIVPRGLPRRTLLGNSAPASTRSAGRPLAEVGRHLPRRTLPREKRREERLDVPSRAGEDVAV